MEQLNDASRPTVGTQKGELMNQPQPIGPVILRQAGSLRCVRPVSGHVWIECGGIRIDDPDSVAATLHRRFHLAADLADDVAAGHVLDAEELQRLVAAGG
jgi:hypothetical protein